MARYVLPIAGAVVGGVFGGPLGAQIGWAIGSALGNAVDPQVIKGPSIGDITQQTSQEGVPRPIVIGISQPIAGNVIATSDPQIVRTRRRQGKGGPKVETETVYRTYAIRICEGPIDSVLRVWRNNQLVYDARTPSSMSDADNARFLTTARFFTGTYDQNPSPDLEAIFGVGTTPAHRGTAYMVMASEDLTDLRGAIPTYQFQVFSESAGAVLLACSHADSNAIARSVDSGETWELVSTPVGDNGSQWLSIAYSPTLDRVVAVGRRTGNSVFIDTMYSDDKGLTWTGLDVNIPSGTGFWSSIIWVPDDGGFFLAAAGSDSGSVTPNRFRKSVDGINWTGITSGLSADACIGDVCYSPELQRLVCTYGGGAVGNSTLLAYSDDFGETWTDSGFAGVLWAPDGFAFHVTGVDWDPVGGRFLAIGVSGSNFTAPRTMVSSDGISWTDAASSFANNMESNRLRYMPIFEMFMATAHQGTLSGGIGRGTVSIPSVEAETTARWFGLAYDASRQKAMVVGSTNTGTGYFASADEPTGAWEVVAMPAPATQWTDVVACYTGLESFRLPSVVARICERAGLTVDMYDVSQLDAEIEIYGMTIINTYPAYAALQALSQVFFFSPSYYDGVLHFIHSGLDSVATVTDDDLVDDHDVDIEESLRDDPISVPRVMHLMYYDIEGGLATDKQSSERAGDYRALGEQSMQSAVLMSAQQAAKAVAVNHKVAVENIRGTIRFCLPDSFIRFVPNDHLIVQFGGVSRRVRITKVEILEGYQQYEVLRDRQSAYTSDVEGIPAAPQTAPPSNIVGPTLIQPLDIHIIRDADDNAGLIYYVAISGTTEAWNGALIELSIDGGQNYTTAMSSTVDTIMGTLEDILPDHPQEYPDETNVLAVSIPTPYAEFDETDLEGLMNRMNYAIVGDEIIQFAEANETSEGHWELSYLLRGRRGTETEQHEIGDRFVLLDQSSLGVIPASVVDIGRTLTFRATSFGETEDTATVVSMTFVGRSQIEREAAYLAAELDGSDAIVTWQGVGRLGAGAVATHGIRFAGYRVTFQGDGVGEVDIVVDTLEQSLTQDVSSLTQPIRISVSQLNDLTGAGPEIELFI